MSDKLVFYVVMLCGLIGFSIVTFAGEFIRPLKPGTNEIDYNATSYYLEGNYLRPMRKGSNQIDHTKNSYIRQGDFLVPLKPGSNEVDYTKPRFKQ